ncbi:MAG: CHASE2 domain-containing protein [Betaproteobacteria bacterium]|nr:MAG: CHASE2 domain-containing protein [Betaproteobacteria bacterium]
MTETRTAFWRSDWFLGLCIALLLLMTAPSTAVQSLERWAYDVGVRASDLEPSRRVAVIGIDDQSIANIGRWPWSRDVHAEMIDRLSFSGPKAVGYMSFFFEPQQDPGLHYIDRLIEVYESLPPEEQTNLNEFAYVLAEAENALNSDRRLSASIYSARNVALPMLFQLGEPRGKPDAALPDQVLSNQLSNVVDRTGAAEQYYFPTPASAAAAPLTDIAFGANAIGHLNSIPDVDGSTRTEALVLRYFDQYYPSFSLMLAAQALNIGPEDIEVRLGEGVRLGNLAVETDPFLHMSTYFYKDRRDAPAFQVDSFYDVLTGRIPAEKYRDKIVLVGATASGVGTYQVTPVSPAMAPVLTLAHTVSSILEEDFFRAPTWATWAQLSAYVFISLYIIVLLPRLSAAPAAAMTLALLFALLATHYVLMTVQLTWLKLMSSAVLLVVGHLALVTKRFIVTERGKLKSDMESAESNRMLGLAFQGQGQLDMAFDKFRQVPLNQKLMDNLFSLALDFERKRQFNKAEAVYQHMASFDPDYRDVAKRRERAKQMSETVILGGGSTHPGGSMALQAGTEKPMLGRYQVEKELGKGAMGVVYVGRDPKIGRIVAIKTVALSEEFDGDELEAVKRRFFREAETAGRLNHPHIVTIYDAGEEHDLAYIAMEFLKGSDLVAYCKPDNLLPIPEVLSLVERVAEALDYAHQHNVVHRDIKPANIMWDRATDSVKVTDFGIARITDSSKTKTGMVLGTPSHMSPEQLAGEKITGQSDLYSLGVTLYQLTCGKLPFEAGSMAQLMYKISNEEPENIQSVNPAVPARLAAVIGQALAKDVSRRFRSGHEMAQALRDCMQGLVTVDVQL